MFGRGRFQNGILIEVKPAYEFDPNDTEKRDAFITDIWFVFLCSREEPSRDEMFL
jgi:hypothetical protein